MKKILFSIVLVLLVCNLTYGESEFLKITTVDKILDNVIEKFSKIKTFKAIFYLYRNIDGKEYYGKGVMKFKKPDRFIMKFFTPKDQVIVCDGKSLKIYIPELKVIGEQKLAGTRSIFLKDIKSSLYTLKTKYNYSFVKSNKPVKLGNTLVYELLFEPREVGTGFKQLYLWVSEYWMIVKAKAINLKGDITQISFKDIYVNAKVTDYELEFNPPIDAQTILNPFLFNYKKR